MASIVGGGCFQSVKDIKFESNSQRDYFALEFHLRCFQSVKDIKFESNSQPASPDGTILIAVSSLSKI